MKSNDKNNRRSAGRIVGELSRSAHIYFHHMFRDYPIGHAQVRTLHYLAEHDGVSQNELVKFLRLDKSSVTSQLTNLEKNGYIIRKKSPKDARIRNIHLTDKARKMNDSIREVLTSWSEILLNDFDEEETEKLFFVLEKMRENARKKIKDLRLDEEKK